MALEGKKLALFRILEILKEETKRRYQKEMISDTAAF